MAFPPARLRVRVAAALQAEQKLGALGLELVVHTRDIGENPGGDKCPQLRTGSLEGSKGAGDVGDELEVDLGLLLRIVDDGRGRRDGEPSFQFLARMELPIILDEVHEVLQIEVIYLLVGLQ